MVLFLVFCVCHLISMLAAARRMQALLTDTDLRARASQAMYGYARL